MEFIRTRATKPVTAEDTPPAWTFKPATQMDDVTVLCERCRSVWALAADDLVYGEHTNYGGDTSGGLWATCRRCGQGMLVEYYSDRTGDPARIIARQLAYRTTAKPSGWSLNEGIPHWARTQAYANRGADRADVPFTNRFDTVRIVCENRHECGVTWRVSDPDVFVYMPARGDGQLTLPCRRCGHNITVEHYSGTDDPGNPANHRRYLTPRRDIPDTVRTAAWQRWSQYARPNA